MCTPTYANYHSRANRLVLALLMSTSRTGTSALRGARMMVLMMMMAMVMEGMMAMMMMAMVMAMAVAVMVMIVVMMTIGGVGASF